MWGGGAGPPGRLAPVTGTGTSGQQGQREGPLEPGEQAGQQEIISVWVRLSVLA